MLFELPLVYKVTGVKHGNRRATAHDVVEMVEVDFAVVAEDDAPIAVEWIAHVPEGLKVESQIGYAAPGFSPAPPDGKLHTRLINARHMCPVVGIDMAGWIGPLVDSALLQEKRGVGVWRDIFNLGNLPSGTFEGIEKLGKKGLVPVTAVETTFKTVEKTTRAQALAVLRQAVSDCAFVNDTLYRLCSEPKVIFCEVNVKDERGVRRRGCIPFISCDPDHAAKYLGFSGIGYKISDLKSWKSMVRKCNGLNRQSPGLFEPLYRGRAPIINDILGDPDYRFMRDIEDRMKAFVSKAGELRLREMSTAVIRAYCSVVDANATLRQSGGLDALETALADLVDAARSGPYVERTLAEQAGAIQELLAMRPVEIGAIVQQVRT
ncbi:hypothetical protein [Rhizobium sp. BK176]|uniref:hypothetical protein n=1 Tax=Rhizobium sp. BK176 TaxID=2587071 RepID=UPI002168034C|nr:hypothetical protein [Rhizobium sp. BK176]MCS4088774.1 hypothetical protein [Rhizobium sp. BK176]